MGINSECMLCSGRIENPQENAKFITFSHSDGDDYMGPFCEKCMNDLKNDVAQKVELFRLEFGL